MPSARGRVELLQVNVWHFVAAAIGISASPTRDICVMSQYFLCVRRRGGFPGSRAKCALELSL